MTEAEIREKVMTLRYEQALLNDKDRGVYYLACYCLARAGLSNSQKWLTKVFGRDDCFNEDIKGIVSRIGIRMQDLTLDQRVFALEAMRELNITVSELQKNAPNQGWYTNVFKELRKQEVWLNKKRKNRKSA